MSKPRSELSAIFHRIDGVAGIYFQPNENVKMQYPAIRYTLEADRPKYANNKIYSNSKRYTVYVIDRRPDSPIADAIRNIPYCSFDRTYIKDGLNHFVYTIFF